MGFDVLDHGVFTRGVIGAAAAAAPHVLEEAVRSAELSAGPAVAVLRPLRRPVRLVRGARMDLQRTLERRVGPIISDVGGRCCKKKSTKLAQSMLDSSHRPSGESNVRNLHCGTGCGEKVPVL